LALDAIFFTEVLFMGLECREEEGDTLENLDIWSSSAKLLEDVAFESLG
jgi:hypothetical protein